MLLDLYARNQMGSQNQIIYEAKGKVTDLRVSGFGREMTKIEATISQNGSLR